MAATTRADWAERRLRTAILTGELAPGTRIRIEQLAADWHLSPTPLREAVRSLAQTGLVHLEPQRGATVAGISPEEIANIYELRLLLEPRALRLSLHRRDWAWRADVEAAWSALRAAWGDAQHAPPDIEPPHTAFHEALSAGCANAELLRLTRRLAAQSMRILLLAIAQGRIAGPTLADHAELYAACVDGDVEDAMRVAVSHIGRPMAARIGADAVREIGGRIAEAGGGDPVLAGVLDALT
jgi:GntR family carbon starvation induced transcriptional regulator